MSRTERRERTSGTRDRPQRSDRGTFSVPRRSAARSSALLGVGNTPWPGRRTRQPAELLPQADVVAIARISLVNGTFDQLIALCRRDRYVLLLGPSTRLSPLLFASGVGCLSGAQVTDPETVLRWVAQGAIFRQIRRSGRVLVWQWAGMWYNASHQ